MRLAIVIGVTARIGQRHRNRAGQPAGADNHRPPADGIDVLPHQLDERRAFRVVAHEPIVRRRDAIDRAAPLGRIGEFIQVLDHRLV